jgi:hypothetical protein
VGQDRKGGDRDGHLDDDRADRQEPNFALGLRVHELPNAEPRDLFHRHAAQLKKFCKNLRESPRNLPPNRNARQPQIARDAVSRR